MGSGIHYYSSHGSVVYNRYWNKLTTTQRSFCTSKVGSIFTVYTNNHHTLSKTRQKLECNVLWSIKFLVKDKKNCYLFILIKFNIIRLIMAFIQLMMRKRLDLIQTSFVYLHLKLHRYLFHHYGFICNTFLLLLGSFINIWNYAQLYVYYK